jgi:hypothetical protein
MVWSDGNVIEKRFSRMLKNYRAAAARERARGARGFDFNYQSGSAETRAVADRASRLTFLDRAQPSLPRSLVINVSCGIGKKRKNRKREENAARALTFIDRQLGICICETALLITQAGETRGGALRFRVQMRAGMLAQTCGDIIESSPPPSRLSGTGNEGAKRKK